MSAPARDPLPDALRALALVGVLVVNASGYLWAPWGPLLGWPQPADSVLALGVMGGVAALLQGKAYPLLALLFGAGLALAWRERTADTLARARQRRNRLLVLGLLHGTLLYFGDILTLYALTMPFVWRHVREPWRTLRPRLWRALGWAVLATMALLAMAGSPQLLARDALPPLPDLGDARAPGDLARATDVVRFVGQNASAFWSAGLVGILFGFPVVRLCMLAGVAVVRLRWLTHRRWLRQRRWWSRSGLWLALAANVGYAVLVVRAAQRGTPVAGWIEVGATFISLPLSLSLLALAAQLAPPGRRAWCDALAPLGRRTLSLYLAHALWCVVLYTDVGLGWRPGTAGVFAASLGLWLAAAAAVRLWPGAWPLEAWMGRRT